MEKLTVSTAARGESSLKEGRAGVDHSAAQGSSSSAASLGEGGEGSGSP